MKHLIHNKRFIFAAYIQILLYYYCRIGYAKHKVHLCSALPYDDANVVNLVDLIRSVNSSINYFHNILMT